MKNQDLETLIQEADARYGRAELEAALEAYEAALAEDDTIAWAHSRIGAILAQMNDLSRAESALLRAIELDPTLPQAHSNLGNVYYARGQYQQAVDKYKEAVSLDSNNPTFHENLHAAYKKLGKLTEAVSSLKQAHRLDRDQAKVEAKAKMSAMKENLTKRRGCLGSATLLLILLAITVMVLTLFL